MRRKNVIAAWHTLCDSIEYCEYAYYKWVYIPTLLCLCTLSVKWILREDGPSAFVVILLSCGLFLFLLSLPLIFSLSDENLKYHRQCKKSLRIREKQNAIKNAEIKKEREGSDKRTLACHFLEQEIGIGGARVSQLREKAKRMGISRSTLNRAKKIKEIKTVRKNGLWIWERATRKPKNKCKKRVIS